ncbi:MAG: ABC transporter substrate-binding protein [Actinobacteria bacterium]|nr:ABC transporter substrate-binding protein [Actinomycetota bacterium]
MSKPSRRPTRLLLTLATAGALALSGCTGAGAGGENVDYTTLPNESGTPVKGGVATIALNPGLSPNYIFPYPPAEVSGTVISRGVMWRALYRPSGTGDSLADEATSLAELPQTSEDGKTVTIKMKDYSWSNGKPLTAEDVVFSFAVLKAAIAQSPANWSFYTPGQFPDGVTASAPDAQTLVLNFETAYNPSYVMSMLQLLYVMPSADWAIAEDGGELLDYHNPENASAIYDYLTSQSEDQSSFATNPLWQIVNGPYSIKSFESSTGSYSLQPNENYSGPGEQSLEQVDFNAFTSPAAVLNQLKAGDLTVGTLDSSYASQIPELQKLGYHVYGAAAPARFDALFINFENTVENFDKVIAQDYVRQALQHLIDQPGYIKSRGVYAGAGSENYSPDGADSPFPVDFGDNPPYPYDPAAAKKLLEEHGWTVDAKGTTCTDAGSGEGQCGEGIEKGQKIAFTIASANSPAYVGSRDLAFVSEAKKLGIDIDVVTKSLNFMYANYGNSYAPANVNEWAMQDFGPLYNAAGYPTSNTVFNTGGSFNLGSYSNPEVDEAINASTFGLEPEALRTEATLLAEDLPVLFFPTPHTLVVWKDTLSGPPATFHSLLSFIYSPEQWYFTEETK